VENEKVINPARFLGKITTYLASYMYWGYWKGDKSIVIVVETTGSPQSSIHTSVLLLQYTKSLLQQINI